MKLRPAKHGRDHRKGGWDPIPGGDRIVYGSVLNDGGVRHAGSGDWSCVWSNSGVSAPGFPATNLYTFTIDPGFPDAPIVVASPNNDNAAGDAGNPAAYFVGLDGDPTTTGFVIVTFDLIGDPDSGGFDFAAFGVSA